MNEQEKFWAGKFGDDYTVRIDNNAWIESNIAFFSNALVRTREIKTTLELGCNCGLNLAALEYFDPSITKTGVDVNAKALHQLSVMFDEMHLDQPFTYHSTAANFVTDERYDLVFTKGLLIHIAPEQLPAVYDKMVELSSRYILIAEYYNPVPVEVPYRGFNGKLFKRDFAGEMLDNYPLKLIDYGFVYYRDEHPQDSVNWFIMEKI